MQIYINGVNGIKDFTLSLEKFTIIGGINSTRKTTILKIINTVLGIYYTTEKQIMEEYLNQRSWETIYDLAEMEYYNLVYTQADILQSSSLEEMVEKLNINIEYLDSRYFDEGSLPNRIIEQYKIEKIEMQNVINYYFDNTLRKFNFMFEDNAVIRLKDSKHDIEILSYTRNINDIELTIQDDELFFNNRFLAKNVVYKSDFSYGDIKSSREYDDSVSLLSILSALEFKVKRNKGTGFSISENGNEFKLERAASGMQIFAYLENLYRYDYLNEGDWLILDEPDVHLHPNWQLLFTELIRFISEKLRVNIIMSSHKSLTIENLLDVVDGQILLMQKIDGNIVSKICSNEFHENQLLTNLSEAYYARYM